MRRERLVGATLLEHALACDRCRGVVERLMLKDETVQHALDEGVLPPMRRQLELQRMHDLLREVLMDRALRERLLPDPLQVAQATMALSTLCWALGHTHLNDRREGFEQMAFRLESVLEANGYVLREMLDPPPPRKPPEPKRQPSRKPPAAVREEPPMGFDFDADVER